MRMRTKKIIWKRGKKERVFARLDIPEMQKSTTAYNHKYLYRSLEHRNSLQIRASIIDIMPWNNMFCPSHVERLRNLSKCWPAQRDVTRMSISFSPQYTFCEPDLSIGNADVVQFCIGYVVLSILWSSDQQSRLRSQNRRAIAIGEKELFANILIVINTISSFPASRP
jgi:hypothetical protein